MKSETLLSEPSRFWARLGEQHARDLEVFGFESIKRRQALRYFTWRWRWGQLPRSEQMRFLLSHTFPGTWLRCVSEPIDLSDGVWSSTGWARHERWLYVVAVRLLWEYTSRHDLLRVLSLPEPELGNPLPVFWQGRLISQDLANSALEANALSRALAGARPRSILEIGAGYGRTAYVLLHMFPEASYTVIDIEPALSVSRWYLSQLFPGRDLRFLPPDRATHLPRSSVDLAFSISSLQEMNRAQVQAYLSMVDWFAAGGIVYLKQWASWHNPEDGLTLNFDEYPIPEQWRLLYKEPVPVQTRFTHAAWHVTDLVTRDLFRPSLK